MILSALIKNKEYLKQELWRKKEEIKSLEEVIDNTNKIIRQECDHNLITDHIDNKYGEGSQLIIYCDKCQLNLKDNNIKMTFN